MAETFNRALVTAARRASSDQTDPGNSLLNQAVTLQATAESLWVDDFRAAYEAEPAAFYLLIVAAADAFYGQLHATTAAAAHLVAARIQPGEQEVKSLAALQQTIDQAPGHPLAGPAHRISRELSLLRWLSTVRNKAVQHRAEEGYAANRAIVLSSAMVFGRKPGPPPGSEVRKAQDLLRGLSRTTQLPMDPGTGANEAIACLDVVSHSLFAGAPSRFDGARRVVKAAGMHDLVVSRELLSNADVALSCLLRLIEPDPASPFAPE